MQYRVRFSFNPMMNGYYYTEWFETLDEAKDFVMFGDMVPGFINHQIENEEGEVI